MRSPFPGMDPYLEQPFFWPEFRARLIIAIANHLAPRLRPRYYVGVEVRTYEDDGDAEILVGIPDVVVTSNQPRADLSIQNTIATAVKPRQVSLPVPIERKYRYLEIREVGTDRVIVAIELLSPINKRAGEGRDSYKKKRQSILASQSHLVEIDLLRANQPMPIVDDAVKTDYRILVSNAESRPIASLYDWNLPELIPVFEIPLQNESIPVDLKPLMDEIYEQSSYDFRIDYQQAPPAPQLSPNN
jgi:hypothetical protein